MAKKANKKTARGAKASPMDFMLNYMKKSPEAPYRDVAAAAKKAGHSVYPIMFGRAQVLLGIRKAKPRGAKKSTAAASTSARRGRKPAAAAPEFKVKRGPGRPRKNAPAAGAIPLQVAGAAVRGRWRPLADHLKGGGRVGLRYAGGEWMLATS